MDKLAKIIRVLTVPPLLALVLITVLYVFDSSLFGSLLQYCALVLFLTLMPLVAYPLQPLIPFYKDKGRKGQRDLAFVASVIGYVCGIIFALVTGASKAVLIIYFTYFLSVVMLTIFNNITKWKASGHACGVAGPIAALIYFIGIKVIPLVLIFAAMCWASLKTKRHTWAELLLGGVDAVLAFLFVIITINYIF